MKIKSPFLISFQIVLIAGLLICGMIKNGADSFTDHTAVWVVGPPGDPVSPDGSSSIRHLWLTVAERWVSVPQTICIFHRVSLYSASIQLFTWMTPLRI